MISIRGSRVRHCDGISRRGLLIAGAAGIGGLSLAQLLAAEAAAGVGSSQKALINVHLDGGPPQLDTIDVKPYAPVEVRGEFQPIATRIPGFHVGDLLPKLAAMADRFAFIRSLVGAAGKHNAFQCQSGFREEDLRPLGGRPAVGCVLSRLLGTATDPAPTFVDMMQGRGLVRDSARPGFVGPAYRPFRPDISSMFQRELEEGMKGELASKGANHTTSLKLIGKLDAHRVDDRVNLLSSIDRMRRRLDASGQMDAMDRFTQQAVGILLSGRFADALDLEKEAPRVLARYDVDPASIPGRHATSDLPEATRKFLLARRLVEAGVRCVSMSISDFDTHSTNFPRMRQVLPIVDHGLTTLVADLEERGMLDDVSIVIWGEFGRTPKINKRGGRDHWPKVSPAMVAGGGMKTGQVLGSTDRTASAATSRPVTHKDVFATLYHNLGIDARRTTIRDTSGRPQYLLDEGEVIRELT